MAVEISGRGEFKINGMQCQWGCVSPPLLLSLTVSTYVPISLPGVVSSRTKLVQATHNIRRQSGVYPAKKKDTSNFVRVLGFVLRHMPVILLLHLHPGPPL